MQRIYHVFFFFPVITSFFLCTSLLHSLPLTCFQQALQWTRMGWFILLMAPQSEKWTKTASSPLSSVRMTWHRLARWPVTIAWTSIRWLKHRSASRFLVWPVWCTHHCTPSVWLLTCVVWLLCMICCITAYCTCTMTTGFQESAPYKGMFRLPRAILCVCQ